MKRLGGCRKKLGNSWSPSRFKPFVEALEDRTLLATLVWNGPENGLWSVARNWTNFQTGAQALAAPANGDTVQFAQNPKTKQSTSSIDNIRGLALNVLDIKLDYDATITLRQSLSLTGTRVTVGNTTFVNEMTSGTIAGADLTLVSGATFIWTGGIMRGNGNTIVQGASIAGGRGSALNINVAAKQELALDGRYLVIEAAGPKAMKGDPGGQLIWTTGTIGMANGAKIVTKSALNRDPGVFDAKDNSEISLDQRLQKKKGVSISPSVENGGAFFKSGGLFGGGMDDNTRIDVFFNDNGGLVKVSAIGANLNFRGGGITSGGAIYQASETSVVTFTSLDGTSQTYDFTGSVFLAGLMKTSGLYAVERATMLIRGGGSVNVDNFKLTIAGIVDGPGRLAILNSLIWDYGIMRGNGQTVLGKDDPDIQPNMRATGTIGGLFLPIPGTYVQLIGRTFSNYGNVQLVGLRNPFRPKDLPIAQSFVLGGRSQFLNFGSFAITDDSSIEAGPGGGTFSLRNDSNLKATATALKANIVKSGGDGVKGSFLEGITFTTNSPNTPLASTGLLVFESGNAVIQKGGVINLNAANKVQLFEDTKVEADGTLTGAGNVRGKVINGGQVIPGGKGAVGVIAVAGADGAYTQSASGSLVIDITGPNAGTDYDQLTVTGPIMLSGTLDITAKKGFRGTSFIIVDNLGPKNSVIKGVFDKVVVGGQEFNAAEGSVIILDGRNFTITYKGGSNKNSVELKAVPQAQIDTNTTVVSSANPSVFGEPVFFTAAVSPATGTDTPTGTEQFQIDGSNFGVPVVLTNGSAVSDITDTLAVGSHTVVAMYSPDTAAFVASAGTLSQTVNKADTTTTLSSLTNPSVYGQSVEFVATVEAVAPGSGLPSGQVDFNDGSAFLGSGNLVLDNLTGKMEADFQTSSLSAGSSHAITAAYQGDISFNGSSGSLTQTVNAASTTTSVNSAINPTVFGQSTSFTATVAVQSQGSGTPTGSVQFQIDGSNFGTPVTLINGIATSDSTSSLAVTSHTVSALYTPDTTSFLASSGSLTQVVNAASTTTTITPLVSSPVVGQTNQYTATVSPVAPGPGTPQGSVQFSIDGSLFGLPVTLVNGSATSIIVAPFSSGTHVVTAVFTPSDGNFTGSTGTLSQFVGKASTTTSLTINPLTAVYGQSINFSVTVDRVFPAVGFPANGSTVTLFDSLNGAAPTIYGTLILGQSGIPLPTVQVGTNIFTAVFNGDANDFTSTSSPVTVTVSEASTTTTVQANGATQVSPGIYTLNTATQQLNLFAQVDVLSPGAGTPTGTVTFAFSGPTNFTIVDVLGQPGQNFTLQNGTYTIYATYSGDGNFNGSTSSTITLTVNPPPAALVAHANQFGQNKAVGNAAAGLDAFFAQLSQSAGAAGW
jgi:hypothetical protein